MKTIFDLIINILGGWWLNYLNEENIFVCRGLHFLSKAVVISFQSICIFNCEYIFVYVFTPWLSEA
jgi:hypothetical protein